MKAWGGAVFPVLVNMAVDTVDGRVGDVKKLSRAREH